MLMRLSAAVCECVCLRVCVCECVCARLHFSLRVQVSQYGCQRRAVNLPPEPAAPDEVRREAGPAEAHRSPSAAWA